MGEARFVNRGALIVHEGLYHWARLQGAKNSLNARNVVGHVFSDFAFVPLLDGIPSESRRCSAQIGGDLNKVGFEFNVYAVPQHPDSSAVQFTTIRGYVPFAKTVGYAPLWPFRAASGYYFWVSSSPETFDGLMVRERKNGAGDVTGYYFDEPDGQYDIRCTPAQAPVTLKYVP